MGILEYLLAVLIAYGMASDGKIVTSHEIPEEKTTEINSMYEGYEEEMAQIQKEEDERARKNSEILCKVLSMVSKKDAEGIKEELKESGWTSSYEIVTEALGRVQDDEQFEYGHMIVDQTTNGGYSGDDFAGHVYIPISKTEFFKFYYSC